VEGRGSIRLPLDGIVHTNVCYRSWWVECDVNFLLVCLNLNLIV
jgi:hypothetical protein